MIFLDTNSTAPIRPESLAAMLPWLTGRPGNAASAHAAGRAARRAVEDAREQLAQLLGAQPDELIFTSGATEGNNLAVFGLAGELPSRLISSRIEHPCVVAPLERLAARGHSVTWLPVTEEGLVDSAALDDSLSPDTRLVAVMLANHETGAVQPISKLRDMASGIAFHCDAAQAVGKIPVNFHKLGVSTLSVSAHKFGGPPGIGALLVNRCTPLRPLLFGGQQQSGRRPGTEPVALIVGMAAALVAAQRHREIETLELHILRQGFLDALIAGAAPVTLNGPTACGLAHVVNLSFPGCRGDALLMALDLAGVYCSTGSACSSGSLLPSPVLRAMGLPDQRLQSALRFSFGPTTTSDELAEAARRIIRVVGHMRSLELPAD